MQWLSGLVCGRKSGKQIADQEIFASRLGGVQINVVPDELAATFDVRLTPNLKLEDFDRQVQQWINDAGEGVSIHYNQKHMDQVTEEI